MICSHCGKEFKQGLVYCPHCGKMQQLVPDYFEAEEEILKDGEKPHWETPEEPQQAPAAAKPQKRGSRKKTNRKTVLIIVVIVLAAAGIAGGILYQNSRNNSYEVQLSLAQQAWENGNYEKGIRYARRALTLNSSSTDARILLYRLCDANGEQEVSLLTEVLSLDPDNEEAYQLLISYYDEADDYDTLLEMAQNVPDESILALFDGYITASPSFLPDGGTFAHNTMIMIESDDTVYYTLDGSTPTVDSTLYEEGFTLEAGTWILSAVAVDADGKYSLVVTDTYIIDPEVPDAVTISPSGGTYTSQITISIRADDECTIYYAWDTTDPDEITTLYTGPITIKEGNHILSAIAVSEDGLVSEVNSRSFIYLPKETDTETED